MTTLSFSPDAFREMFKAFSSPSAYSDESLLAYWNLATIYISKDDSPALNLTGAARSRALDLMAAHLITVNEKATLGQSVGNTQQATIDKVSVTLTPPPIQNGWQWWLCSTQYGAQLWALLESVMVGGLHIGGYPELAAFRAVGGVFR